MKRIIQALAAVAIVMFVAAGASTVLRRCSRRAGHDRLLCTCSGAKHNGVRRHRLADAVDGYLVLSDIDRCVLRSNGRC